MKKFQHLLTAEGEALLSGVDPIPWNVYPRPQMQRDSFFCLNGKWKFNCGKGEEEILVPFSPESRLSGICRSMGRLPKMIYKRSFQLPADFRRADRRDRVLLHFGAVDQIAKIKLNGVLLGEHVGGYEHFSFDITERLSMDPAALYELEVQVVDRLKDAVLPYGKQRQHRGGMWYTPVSGIWQTVWMECVPEQYIRELRIDTTEHTAAISVQGVSEGEVILNTPNGENVYPLQDGRCLITLESPRQWSPADPYLYRFTIHSGEDTVNSYFAMRTLDIRKVNGIHRLCLNKKPYFFHGLLDQGYYSDGIYTPASPVCFEQDILTMKALGFNTLRKHIKMEPEQFYYDCDRLGMIVWQDMINNGRYSFLRDTALPTLGLKTRKDTRMHRSKKTREAFLQGMQSVLRELHNHPCVCYWTIFNEGWGQFDSGNTEILCRRIDDSRFIDTASGWFGGAPSDVESMHIYFRPVTVPKADKPVVLSEFGGIACKIQDHCFNRHKTYGYTKASTPDAYMHMLEKLYCEQIIPAVSEGLCGAVYTQLSDVEDETNGLVTYDRRVCKVDPVRMQHIAEALEKAIHR